MSQHQQLHQDPNITISSLQAQGQLRLTAHQQAARPCRQACHTGRAVGTYMLLQPLAGCAKGCRVQLLSLMVGAGGLQQRRSFLAARACRCCGGLVGCSVQLLPSIPQALLRHHACHPLWHDLWGQPRSSPTAHHRQLQLHSSSSVRASWRPQDALQLASTYCKPGTGRPATLQPGRTVAVACGEPG